MKSDGRWRRTVPESNLMSLLDHLDFLRSALNTGQDPQQRIILEFWLKELEDDLLCGFVALEQEFIKAWNDWQRQPDT